MEKKSQNKRARGATYEQAVGYYLERQGYEVLTFNYRCPLGGFDVVGVEGSKIMLVKNAFEG